MMKLLDLAVTICFIASMLTIVSIMTGCASPVKITRADSTNNNWYATVHLKSF